MIPRSAAPMNRYSSSFGDHCLNSTTYPLRARCEPRVSLTGSARRFTSVLSFAFGSFLVKFTSSSDPFSSQGILTYVFIYLFTYLLTYLLTIDHRSDVLVRWSCNFFELIPHVNCMFERVAFWNRQSNATRRQKCWKPNMSSLEQRVMWVRQFSRDRNRGRGSNDEAETRRGKAVENQAEARPRQGSQKTM